ncbi:unnamed protein product [Pieris macdunnoughi]|uniref:Uncharacterized protein n=1 Tax=Pieris macdunnoughi TaxID=345717 RepID=A0A821W781_9NEOP|nr:unnamed protein product [Pieris macdunnoughi]
MAPEVRNYSAIFQVVRGGSTGVPPPAPPAHDTEKRSPLLPQHQQQPRPAPVPVVEPVPEPPPPVVVKPIVVKAVKNVKINQKVTGIEPYPALASIATVSLPPRVSGVGRVSALFEFRMKIEH